MTFAFPKQARLLYRGQFRRLGRSRNVVHGQYVTVKWQTQSLPLSRLGITASKKFGKAHERNRFKRIVREAFRFLRPELIEGLDLLVYPRLPAKDACTQKVIEELRRILPSSFWS